MHWVVYICKSSVPRGPRPAAAHEAPAAPAVAAAAAAAPPVVLLGGGGGPKEQCTDCWPYSLQQLLRASIAHAHSRSS